jgi:hypothetical protein
MMVTNSSIIVNPFCFFIFFTLSFVFPLVEQEKCQSIACFSGRGSDHKAKLLAGRRKTANLLKSIDKMWLERRVSWKKGPNKISG